MFGWIGVFLVWFGMFITVLWIRHAVRSYKPTPDEAEPDELAEQGHAPSAAWKELDTQMARHGAGHPLQ